MRDRLRGYLDWTEPHRDIVSLSVVQIFHAVASARQSTALSCLIGPATHQVHKKIEIQIRNTSTRQGLQYLVRILGSHHEPTKNLYLAFQIQDNLSYELCNPRR